MPFEDYQALLCEIETTQMAPVNGHPSCRKIYKMVLLLAMLERGLDAWWMPITPAEAAPYFHRFLTDNDVIRELQFNDRDKQQFKYRFDEAAQRFTERLIRTMPMTKWSGSGEIGKYDPIKDSFRFQIEIRPADRHIVFQSVRAIARHRIEEAMPGHYLEADFDHIALDYTAYHTIAENASMLGPVERDAYLKRRVGQGKFRNRLMERFDCCVLCELQHPKLLIASHIKPWCECGPGEHMDLDNAFILCPTHDRLFDALLISFDDQGQTLIAKDLERHYPEDLQRLQLPNRLVIKPTARNIHYLGFHNQQFTQRGVS